MMASKGSHDHNFINYVFSFLGFMLFIIGLGAPEALVANNIEESVVLPSETETCMTASGIGDSVSCFFENIGFFFSVAVFQTDILWFSLLVLTPMLVTLIFIIIRLLPFIG